MAKVLRGGRCGGTGDSGCNGRCGGTDGSGGSGRCSGLRLRRGVSSFAQSFERQELLGNDDECEMVMQTGPRAPLVVVEAQ